MSHCPQALTSAVAAAWPVERWRDLHVLVAVSGGADSVALLTALAELKLAAGGKGKLMVAHFNHRMRGEAADNDAIWVAQLANQLSLPIEQGVAPAQASLQSEAGARDARYDFLRDAAHRLGVRCVATGHTADDQVETILHRVLRGSGLAGLRGVPFSRPMSKSVEVVRPLLAVSRQQVEQHLQAIGQEFRTDATNAKLVFTRNRLRNVVLPMLREEAGHDVDKSLLRLGSQAAEAQEVIELLAERVAKRAIRHESGCVVIETKLLAAEPPLVAREACKLAWRRAGWPERDMGVEQWTRLLACLVDPGSEPSMLPGGVRAAPRNGLLELRSD